jgi:hypothetical protein
MTCGERALLQRGLRGAAAANVAGVGRHDRCMGGRRVANADLAARSRAMRRMRPSPRERASSHRVAAVNIMNGAFRGSHGGRRQFGCLISFALSSVRQTLRRL